MGTGHQLTARLPFSLVGPAQNTQAKGRLGMVSAGGPTHEGLLRPWGWHLRSSVCRLELVSREQSR